MWILIKNLCLSLLAINSSSLDQAVSGGPYSSIPDGDTGKIIRFYEDWRNYLHLSWGTLHAVAGFFQNVIVQTIFHINSHKITLTVKAVINHLIFSNQHK